MAGTSGAIRLSDDDKARILATLAANGGNVKRTARELNVQPATVRRYRDRDARGDGPGEAKVQAAVTEFVTDAKRVRNQALLLLERRIKAGDITSAALVTAMGVLDDKVRLAEGLHTSKVEHSVGLPSAEDLQAVLGPVVQQAIENAERRGEEIVDAELVEVLELPQST